MPKDNVRCSHKVLFSEILNNLLTVFIARTSSAKVAFCVHSKLVWIPFWLTVSIFSSTHNKCYCCMLGCGKESVGLAAASGRMKCAVEENLLLNE